MVTLEQLECLRQIAKDYDYGWGQPDGLMHAEQVACLALKMLNELSHLGHLREMSSDRALIQAAGWLHDIGRSTKAMGKGEHNEKGFDTLRQVVPQRMTSQPLPEDELGILLYCVLFHRGHDFSERGGVSLTDPQRTKRLAAILRIADALDHGPPFGVVEDLTLKSERDSILCKVFCPKEMMGIVISYATEAGHKADLFLQTYEVKISFQVIARQANQCVSNS